MEEPRLMSMAATQEGGLRLHFAPGPMLQLWASEMTKLLKDNDDAPNYVECIFNDMETGQPWILLVQKEDGISPGMKASMANVRANEAEVRVAELEEERDRYRAALSDMSDELSHYPEGNGIFGHLKRILRRALA